MPSCSGVFALLAHEPLAVNLLRRELVVCATAQADVRHRTLAATRDRDLVIELQQRSFGATHTGVTDVRTALAVTCGHFSPDLRRHIPGVRRAAACARRVCVAVLALIQLPHQLREREFQHLLDIAAGPGMRE
jgi:hypothetical protein